MNKHIITAILGTFFLFATNVIMSQDKPDKKNKEEKEAKVKELRKQFFNEKLALSETEQKAFWPVYDEYKLKDRNLRDSFMKKYRKNEIVFMDDKKAEEYLNAMLKLRDDQNVLYKEYINKFKKILPIKKVAMIPMLEREFKEEVLKHAMHHKNGKPDGKPEGKPED